jgi:translation initiation factor 2 alpha subunit (eIF-2alpha)
MTGEQAMAVNQVAKNSHVTSLNRIAKSLKPSQSDPSYEVIDRLDNIWGSYMADFDGAYSENQDISKQELRRLTQILQLMEKNIAAVRLEFERRLDV